MRGEWIVVLMALVVAGCSGSSTAGDTGGPGTDVAGTDLGPVTDTFTPADPGTGQDPGTGPVGCLAATGNPGSATISSAGTPAAILEETGTAQNQAEESFSPLPSTAAGFMARGPCGTVGLLARDHDGGKKGLVYVDITDTPGTPETVDGELSFQQHRASLVFDQDCAPLALIATDGDGYIEYARGGTDWTKKVVGGVADALGEDPSWVTHRDAWTAQDGTLHVLADAKVSDVSKVVHGNRPAAAGSAWTFQAFEPPSAVDVFKYRVATDGTAHVLYGKTEFPCDPCDMGLYYGRMAPGGAWTEELVQDSKWGEPDDEFARDPSMVLDGSGEPVVAATFQTRVITGSLKSSALRVYGRDGGAWCHEVVATQVDGYQGQDGTAFTGAQPHLALDDTGRPHVVFSDVSAWHDGNGWSNTVTGQVRYAIRTGSTWTVATLFKQPGRTDSPNPLNGFDGPRVLPSPGGTGVHVAGVERVWETDSIYNDQPVPLTLRATVLRADITLP